MPSSRPDPTSLIGKDVREVPMSCQRIMEAANPTASIWIGPNNAKPLNEEDQRVYDLAHTIMCHLAIKAPRAHSSGHPGGPLSAFTTSYLLGKRRDPAVDQPLRMSAGHLSVLAYGLQWLFGREATDKRLTSPQAIIDNFRVPTGLPGHIEAGIGDIPFGTGPLGKGVSNALGAAFGLKYWRKPGIVDVLMADGDSQEGQIMEAFRLAARLKVDNLIVHGDFNDVQLSGLPSETVAADFASIAAATGWHVIEVQNGNDPALVNAALDEADTVLCKGKPIFVCYYTTMGYGVPVMEEGSNTGERNYHGTPLSDEEAEIALRGLPSLEDVVNEYQPFRDAEHKRYERRPRVQTNFAITWDIPRSYERTITSEKGSARKDFGATHIYNLMKADDRIVVLHADLAGSGGFDAVEKEFPRRCINVGVAENNMLMMAAGMRQVGMLPVTYTFATFGTNEARASARLIDINCGHTRCGIVNDCTHAGLSVGEDGETHQERNYLNVPFDHTQIWMTADSNQTAAMAERAMAIIANGSECVYTFFPRSSHEQLKSPDGEPIYGKDYVFDGKADLIRGQGNISDHITVIATGMPVHNAVIAAERLWESSEKLSVRVLNVACVRPIDAAAVIQAALETAHLIVVEDHNSEGGLASQVADVIADFALPCSLRRLGVNHYFPSAKDKELMVMAGLDTDSIADAIQDEARREVRGGEDALVTALYEIAHNLHQSRFEETAKPFVKKLLDEDGTIDTLRQFWKGRESMRRKMPSSEELLKRMQEVL